MLWASAGPKLDLEWSAPAECPDEAAVEAKIDGYLGDVPASTTAVEAKGTVTRERDGWTMTLVTTVDGHRRTRVLTDPGCDGLAESAAVLVAIAVAPETVPPAPPVPVETDERAETPVALTDPDPQASARPTSSPGPIPESTGRPRARRLPLRASVRATGGVGLGWLPFGADVSLALAVFGRGFRAELFGTYAPRRLLRFDDLPEAGANVSAWSLGMRGCGVPELRSWLQLPICAGVEAGRVVGRPVGLLQERTGRPVWAAGALAAGLRFEVHERVALWVAPELLVAMTRPTLRVDGEASPIFRSSNLGGRFQAGLELRFL